MLDKLEMYIAVAREEHFGRAAAALGITQPTLSAGVKQLEEQLGVQLIFRGSRYGGLTPEGQSALIWARKIVGDSRQLKEEMRFSRHGLTGQLRIAVIPTALTWAAKLTARFSEKHPNVRFTILSRTSAEILSMIENFSVDAGISYLDNEPMGKVSSVPLYREHYMLVCHRASPFADRKTVGWAELNGQKLCLLTPDMQNRRIIDKNFRESGVSPEAWIESNSTIVLTVNVEDGGWMTVLPSDMARSLAAGKPLKIIPMEAAEVVHTVGLVAPYREPHTPVLKALLTEARRMSKADQ
ncbi:LysR family transcriptional regulator [Leisingera sp.]|uniref:LysR family transcriptional regulator n=1 Tax=Leisingera sp. TaxID=1879318 RepID=UPI002B26C89E|nr:LysR family transcriptional regulator [Leisingera sp.]